MGVTSNPSHVPHGARICHKSLSSSERQKARFYHAVECVQSYMPLLMRFHFTTRLRRGVNPGNETASWEAIQKYSLFCLDSFLQSHLKLYSHHMKGGRAGQDGGVGLKKTRQCCPTVPEEQRVPGQEAGAEVRLTNQDWYLGEIRITLNSESRFINCNPTCCSPKSLLVSCSGLMSSRSTAPFIELASNNCRDDDGTNQHTLGNIV